MTDENMTPPEPPDSLGVRGAEFWRELHAEMEFDAKETSLLLEACRCLDMIDDLTAAIERDGLMVTGSTGQRVVNGAVAEVRQWQASFGRLMGLIRLPEDELAADRFRHQRAKAGAAARWERPTLKAVR